MARGGYRPGAGRPKGAKSKNATPKPPKEGKKATEEETSKEQPDDQGLDPLAFMIKTMNDPKVDIDIRTRLAIAAAPFVHNKVGDPGKKGKKDERGDAAKKAGSGKFAPSPAPLKAIQGGK